MKYSSIFFVLILLFSIHRGFTLKCYECGPKDEDCYSNPRQDKYLRICHDGISSDIGPSELSREIPDVKMNVTCQKYVAKSKTDENKVYIVRGCGIYSERACEMFNNTKPKEFEIVDTCKSCDTDLCNSASKTDAAIYGLRLILFMIWKFGF